MEGIFIGVLCLSGCLTFSTCLLHQYHFVSEAMNWTEAQSYCREKYTDLATVENTEEMKKLKDTVSAAGKVWIGLYSHIDWKWSDGFHQSGAEYRNWKPNEPNYYRANELCVFKTKYGKWHDCNCQKKNPFVCYRGTFEDSDFVLVETPKNWSEAQRHCRGHYTDLVTVRNNAENKKIKNKIQDMIKRHKWAWIGLYRDPQIYWSDGSNYSFSSWSRDANPLGSMKVVCGVADLEKGGKWRLISCEDRKPFICYRGTLEDSDFVLVNRINNWSEAQSYCREEYTDLATIENTEEMQKLKFSAAGHSSEVWIGLFSHIDWKWSDGFNQSGAEYRNWKPNEPTYYKANELCVNMKNDGEWHDYKCHEKKPFVCYRGTFEDSDFVLVETPKNWSEAQRHCRGHYTDLVTVRNNADNKKIKNKIQDMIKRHKWAWNGLYRDLQMYWSDGSNYSFSSWSRDANPLGSMKVVCGVADLEKGGNWRLIPCEERKPFVCYSMRGWCFFE